MHIVDPLIVSDLRASRAKPALASFGNMVDLAWMIWTCKGGIAKTIRFSTIEDLPDVESGTPSDQGWKNGKELVPVIPEYLFESKTILANGLHNG